ncbi:MAG TPA: hypothetical protein VF169_03215 [Albitalea sp.]|uniref:hypothetical protein n=1 Tax=Piscinibacter sp. TaxID=1903157 RepID=UPI002ECFF396
MFSLSLISHSPENLQRLASSQRPPSPAGRPLERHGALAIAIVASIGALLMVLATA